MSFQFDPKTQKTYLSFSAAFVFRLVSEANVFPSWQWLELSMCSPLPIVFLDIDDGALNREHPVSFGYQFSPVGYKEKQNQIAFKVFHKSEYTFLAV